MVRCARAWGLFAAIGGAAACNLDASGLGSEGTASPIDPSTTGSDAATTTSGDTTTGSGSTAALDDTAAPGSTSTGDPPAPTDDGTTTAAGSSDTQSGPKELEYCFDVHASIPDANAAGIASSFAVPETGSIIDVRLVIQATHTWVGDLVFELSNDSGTTLAVIDRPGEGGSGCGGHDIDVVLRDDATETLDAACSFDVVPALDGTLLPDNPFAPAFAGEPTADTWRLRAIDENPNDIGTLERWCLQLTYE